MSVTIRYKDCPEELEMNLSNSNFHQFFLTLGIVADCCGSEDPKILYNLCKTFSPGKIVSESHQDGNFYDCGRSLEQTTGYKWRLMRLCVSAMKANVETIHWG